MELFRLIEALSDPAAYPDPVDAVEVRQTHISVVFLAGPLRLQDQEAGRPGLPRLQHAGEAPALLRGGGPPQPPPGARGLPRGGRRDPRWRGVRMEGEQGEVVEWAVKMERLPDEATLQERLRRGDGRRRTAGGPGAPDRRLPPPAEAGAHRGLRALRRGGRQRPGELRAVGGQVGDTVSPGRLRAAAGTDRGGPGPPPPLIEARAARGVPRDTHGDLRLDHVYSFPDREPPGRPGHHRLHRVQRAVPLRRPGGRHGLPGHGPRLPRPAGPGPGLRRGLLPGRGRRGGPARCCRSTRPTGPRCAARWRG